MTLSGVGTILRGVIGCLVLLEINAQYNGYNSYYDQEAYYKQYPQYTPSQSNAYHGYTTPQTVKPNPNNVHVIEISIPDNVAVNAAGLISQLLSETGASNPNAFSMYAYPDTSSSQTRPPNQKSNNQQTNYYYQQQQYQRDQYAYQQTLKQQQYQKELQQYEQKLREYYAQYPSAIPQQVTTVRPVPPKVINPPVNPIQPAVQPIKPPVQPIEPVPITPNLIKPKPDDGKSLADLLLANQGIEGIVNEPTTPQSGGGKSLADLIAELPPGPPEKDNTETFIPPTEPPKKSLDDLIGNVFVEKPSKPATESPNAGGKSLAELLADLPPLEEPEPEKKSHESDVAGGDYGLDVRADESKAKRVKRHIIRETIRKMTDRISSFASERFNRDKTEDDCNHHEGRDHHSSQHHHGRGHEHDREHHRGHEHEREHHHGFEREREHHNGYEYEVEHHRGPHNGGHHNNGNADFNQSHHGKKHEQEHHHHQPTNHHSNVNVLEENDQKPSLLDQDGKTVSQSEDSLQPIRPSRKPQSVDVGTQTDVVSQPDLPRSATTVEPIFDFDVRGGFESRRRKRHNLKRSRRSPDGDDIVFEEEEKKPEKEEAPSSEVAKDTKDETPENATLSSPPANCTEGMEECGELDSRFGFFGGGGGFRQRPIGSLIGGVVSGVLGGVVGGFNGLNQGYDPYRQAGPQYPPQYYNNGQPPPYYGNNYPPPQQPPVHIHINNVANAQSQASNTGGVPGFGSNQNAAANAQSQNYQNEFGSFQNNGASGQASNLAADGSSGQLSAANAMNQNYQNEFGAGSKNTAQSQSANFDPHGNLALTSSNSGTNHFAGPDGVRDETNSAAQSSLQGQFGTQNSGAQSNTYQGPHGSGSSASSQASSINNGGHGFQNSGSNAAANSGNIDGNSFGNAQSGTYTNDQWGW